MGEAFAKYRREHLIRVHRLDQRARIEQHGNVQQLPGVRVVGQVTRQRAQIALGLGFPTIVEVHADRIQQVGPRFFIILAWLAKQQLGNAAAFVVHRLALLPVVLPGAAQAIVVHDLFGILQPFQEGQAAFEIRARRQFARGQFLFGQPAILVSPGGLDPFACSQIAQVPIRNAKHVAVFSG